MNPNPHRVCPLERAPSLDSRFRRCWHNPRRLLGPRIREGMTVLDVGCGPGFFIPELARLVGPAGRVIAADLQEGMLRLVQDKIRGAEWESRVRLHPCPSGHLDGAEPVDFILAFFVVHELPDPPAFFREAACLLRPGGQCLVVEPMGHVSRSAFADYPQWARAANLCPVSPAPFLWFCRSLLLAHPPAPSRPPDAPEGPSP